MPPYELPVEFESPYSLDLCVERLQALIGQEYLLAQLDGALVQVDKKHFDFRLHAYNHDWKAGSRYSNDLIEAEIIGSLHANEDGTTYLSVDDTITGNEYRVYLGKIALVGFIVGAILGFILSRALEFSVIGGLAVALMVPLPVWYHRPYDIDKLLDLLKSTLGATLIESGEW